MEREKEILRQQLELLAERSETCENAYLAELGRSMLDIVSYLDSSFEQIS